MSDICAAKSTPVTRNGEEDILDPDQSRRMGELYDQQGQRPLTDDEWKELDGLVAAYGHRLHERRMRELSLQRDISVEQAERDTAADLAEALAWWQEVTPDPTRLRMTNSKELLGDATAISRPEGARDGCDGRFNN